MESMEDFKYLIHHLEVMKALERTIFLVIPISSMLVKLRPEESSLSSMMTFKMTMGMKGSQAEKACGGPQGLHVQMVTVRQNQILQAGPIISKRAEVNDHSILEALMKILIR